MATTTVRNIPEEHYGLLRREASRQRTSVNSGILDAIRSKTEELRRRRRAAKAMQRIDKLRAEIATKYPHQTDSVELIRKDRDSR
ncbi:MAG TPA: hypothetical protein VMX16_04125 [Terriglobia bacterium]|nr:hypothetical protein [Terriglobia bacterium]